jgi:hypothetical protein
MLALSEVVSAHHQEAAFQAKAPPFVASIFAPSVANGFVAKLWLAQPLGSSILQLSQLSPSAQLHDINL